MTEKEKFVIKYRTFDDVKDDLKNWIKENSKQGKIRILIEYRFCFCKLWASDANWYDIGV